MVDRWNAFIDVDKEGTTAFPDMAIRKDGGWVRWEDYEQLSLKCAALAKVAYPGDLLRLRAGLLAHACYCGSSDLDPAVHREDCAYRKWASPEHPHG